MPLRFCFMSSKEKEIEASRSIGCGFLPYFVLCFFVAGIPCLAALLLWSDIGAVFNCVQCEILRSRTGWGEQVYGYFMGGAVTGYAFGAMAACIVLLLCPRKSPFLAPHGGTC